MYQQDLYGAMFGSRPVGPMPQLQSMGGGAPAGARQSSSSGGMGNLNSMSSMLNSTYKLGSRAYDMLTAMPTGSNVGMTGPGMVNDPSMLGQIPQSWMPEATQTGYSGFGPAGSAATGTGSIEGSTGVGLGAGAEAGALGAEAAGMGSLAAEAGAAGAAAGGAAAGATAAAGTTTAALTAAEIMAILGVMAA